MVVGRLVSSLISRIPTHHTFFLLGESALAIFTLFDSQWAGGGGGGGGGGREGGRERRREGGTREPSADHGNIEGWWVSGDRIHFSIEEAVGEAADRGAMTLVALCQDNLR